MKQMSLARGGFERYGKTTKRAAFLAEMNRVVPWAKLCELIEPHYPKAGRGRQPVGLERMLRIHFLQHWFNLSDPAVEESLYESNSMREFVGIDLGQERVPDETTVLNFRHLLERHELGRLADITYIRTHEGWLYLAVVVDLFSRQVVGWSMGSRIDTGLVLDALLMALWRRKPKAPVTVHSDQGSQFTGHDWQDFLRDHNLVSSMSRRGNCHDNAVAESFFQLLKRERIRRQIYPNRDDARADVFNCIEMFYNPKRRHGTAGDTSPVEFERRHSQRLTSV